MPKKDRARLSNTARQAAQERHSLDLKEAGEREEKRLGWLKWLDGLDRDMEKNPDLWMNWLVKNAG